MLPIAVALARQKSLLLFSQKAGRWHMSLSLIDFVKAMPLTRILISCTAFLYPCHSPAISSNICQNLLHHGWCYYSWHRLPSYTHLCTLATDFEGLFTSGHKSDKIQSRCCAIQYHWQHWRCLDTSLSGMSWSLSPTGENTLIWLCWCTHRSSQLSQYVHATGDCRVISGVSETHFLSTPSWFSAHAP